MIPTNPVTAGLYEQGGAVTVSMILLPRQAATTLREALQSALDSADASKLAAWPRELCKFQVNPHFKGREQYVSFHLDLGAKPMSPGQVRWRRFRDTVVFLMTAVGFVCSAWWLLDAVRAWAF